MGGDAYALRSSGASLAALEVEQAGARDHRGVVRRESRALGANTSAPIVAMRSPHRGDERAFPATPPPSTTRFAPVLLAPRARSSRRASRRCASWNARAMCAVDSSWPLPSAHRVEHRRLEAAERDVVEIRRRQGAGRGAASAARSETAPGRPSPRGARRADRRDTEARAASRPCRTPRPRRRRACGRAGDSVPTARRPPASCGRRRRAAP